MVVGKLMHGFQSAVNGQLPPTISSFSPPSGGVGAEITISGADFIDVSDVSFNGSSAIFSVDSPAQITAQVPIGATEGLIFVVNRSGTGRSLTAFSLESALLRDYTTALGASAIVYDSRSGGDVVMMRGATLATKVAAGTGILFEDRGSGAAGVWSFDHYTGLVSSGLVFNASGWSQFNVTIDSGQTAPDLSAEGSIVRDNSTGAISLIRRQPNANGYVISSLWMREFSPSAPLRPGAFVHSDYPYTSVADTSQGFTHSALFPTGTNNFWRRIVHINKPAGTSFFDVRPAGEQDNASTGDLASLGAIEIWGQQSYRADADLPAVNGGTSRALPKMPTADAAALVNSAGVLNAEIRFYSPHYFVSKVPNGWIWKADTASGFHGVDYTASNNTYTLWVRGETALSAVAGMGFLKEGTGELVGEVGVHAGYDPSSHAFLRVKCGGCYMVDASGAATGTALPAVTSAYLGSNLGASPVMPLVFTARNSYPTATTYAPEGLIIGDSIMAWSNAVGFNGAITDMIVSGALIYTRDEAKTRNGIASIAVAGHTIAQQKAAFQSWVARTNTSNLRWCVIQVGVNDVIAGNSESTIAAALNDLTATIKGVFPTIKIVLNQITPAYAILTAAQRPVRVAVNDDIAGTGANPITNVDAVVTANNTNIAIGSSGVLNPILSQDGIHPSNDGKPLMMAPDRAALISLGELS